jgi:protein SCO1
MRSLGKGMLGVALVLAGVLSSYGADSAGSAANSQIDLQEYTARALRSKFPNVSLTTQDNRTVHFYDDLIKGKIVIIQFMFTNCEELCPMTTPNLVKVQKELQQRGASGQVEIISITVDPVHDTPRVLKEYAKQFHVKPGWRFLTGRKADIDMIRRNLGVWDPDEQKLGHMNMLTMGREPSGQWISIEALAKPDDIAYTVMRLIPPAQKKRAVATSAAARR